MALREFNISGGLSVAGPMMIRVVAHGLDKVLGPAKRGAGRAFASLFGKSRMSITVDLPEYQAKIRFLAKDPYWTRLLFHGITYEIEILKFLLGYQGKTVLFVDAGANLGYWTVIGSSIFGPGSRFLAIEANPGKYEELKANVALNGVKCACVNAAVSDREGDLVVLDCSAGDAAASFVRAYSQSSSARINVSTVDLDTLLRASELNPENFDVAILKLDIEGAETLALRGAASILASSNAVIVYEDHALESDHETTRYLMKAGYVVEFLRGGDRLRIQSPDELDLIKTEHMKGYNFVAYRSEAKLSGSRLANAL